MKVKMPKSPKIAKSERRSPPPRTRQESGKSTVSKYPHRPSQQSRSSERGAKSERRQGRDVVSSDRNFARGRFSLLRTSPEKRQGTKASPLLYCLRMLILGVGISAIVGTLLSVLDPAIRMTAEPEETGTGQKTQQGQAIEPVAQASTFTLKLTQEITPLKSVVQQLAAKNPKLLPGILIVDVDSGDYMDLNGTSTLPAASTIKFPVFVALFQDIDAGKIRLDEILTLNKEMIGGGAGEMQYKPVGTKFTVLETAFKMMTISDNTATNMLIARLGGKEALNQRFALWGLTATQISNPLPDLPGTNTTSPKDLGQLMAMVNQGELISLKSRDRVLDIMRRTVRNTMLPRGLGQGATIAHKTGDIGSLVGDVGLIDLPSGKRYIVAAMVKRPHNDSSAPELIREISKAAYQQFNRPIATPFISTTSASSENPVQSPNAAPNYAR